MAMAMAFSASPNITSYFNRGPLTTTFTPPTTCLQTLSINSFYVGGTPTTATFYGNWFGFEAGYSCLPTGTMPGTLLASPTYWGTYWCKKASETFRKILLILCFVDSPGLYCPTGWTTAGELGSSWNGIHVTGSTSGAICCPS
jgi:hypothetical protein